MADDYLRSKDYDPVEWQDQVKDGSGNVLVQGTPLNEDNLNNIERGILTGHLDVGLIALLALQQATLANKELDKYHHQRLIQGQATISNPAGAGSGYFRSSEPFVSVPIPTDAYVQINAPDYDVLISAVDGDGSEGNLIAYGKTKNGFNVKMTGSAKSVSFLWTIVNPRV